jgi:hypothetical protein
MNETCVRFKVSSASADASTVKRKVYEVANVLQVPSVDGSPDDHLVLKFSAQTLANKSLVLVKVYFFHFLNYLVRLLSSIGHLNESLIEFIINRLSADCHNLLYVKLKFTID